MTSPKVERSFGRALEKTFNDFCKNSSLHGLQYVRPRKDRTLFERCVWWVVQFTAIYCVGYLVLFSWKGFMENPTLTTLDNPNYPITNIPFPAVSLCNLNKISRKRAEAYAKDLYVTFKVGSSRSNQSESKIMNIINYFGKIFDYGSTPNEEVLIQYQAILDTYDIYNKTGAFNTYATFKKLAQPCEEFISDCTWNGLVYDCKHLFRLEITMEGFCCLFNYSPSHSLMRSIPYIIKSNRYEPLMVASSGMESGLSVTIHPDVDDYLYPLISSKGANIHIFNFNDFPDTTSGGLQERLVEIGIQMFVRLYATAIFAVPEVKRYSISKRKCKFRDEAETIFGLQYSYSDCILDCRVKSMLALCECVPFTYIKAIRGHELSQCTLVDIPCLNRYKEKWRRLYPFDYEGDEMESDKQDSLNCNVCVPTCSNTLYAARNDFAYLDLPVNSTSNHSVVNIFFESDSAQLYKQDVVYYWFEIVSSFGGICSLMLGVSLITVMEFIYFFIVALYKNCG